MGLSIDILIIVVLSAPHSHHDIALIKLITVLLLFSIICICVIHVYLLSNHNPKCLNTDSLSNGFPYRNSLIFSGIFFLEKNS